MLDFVSQNPGFILALLTAVCTLLASAAGWTIWGTKFVGRIVKTEETTSDLLARLVRLEEASQNNRVADLLHLQKLVAEQALLRQEHSQVARAADDIKNTLTGQNDVLVKLREAVARVETSCSRLPARGS